MASRLCGRRNFFVKWLFLFFPLVFIMQICGKAQTPIDLSNVKVEELTDDQVRKFIIESDRAGLRDEQMEQTALQLGMNPVELVKFKDRVQSVRKSLTASNYKSIRDQEKVSSGERLSDSVSALEQRPVADLNAPFNELRTKTFGSEIFSNPRLTFEPNLRLPTPKNYLLAADDELVIDVSGYSEANYHLKVSPEGIIRIPVAGPVAVNGLTIEQAKHSIINKLANTIYSAIKTGNTSVEVTLGAIRSIKVTIIGEATLPGTYTLPSLATAYNALYACGGPNSNGSYRNIQVIRNNKTIATIDVYQYLVNGNKKNDIHLMDQDVIRIATYETRIEIKGEVKKPGMYDVLKTETLDQIMSYAGGFTDNAYTERIQVFKNTSRDRKVTTITESQIASTVPERGDSYIIGKILNRFTNRISIKGAVYRPGEYELKEGMTLSQLINEADGVREDAFMNRGTIHRLKEDLSPEIISFDLEKLLSGKKDDIKLRREDRVNIYSKFDLKEGYYVTIEGEVSAPGIFLYEEGITVQDLILLSGGLKEAASVKRIEVSRRIKDADTTQVQNKKTAIIYQRDINPSLKDSSGATTFILEPFDEVYIYPAPGYFVQKNVVIEGEVLYAGKYSLEAKSDKISDLVKRAGGFTPEAYLQGAVLVRSRNFSKTEQNNNEQGFNNLLKQNFEAGAQTPLLLNQLAIARRRTDNVGIDLPKILASPGSAYDLLLNDGDTLRIPKQLQTVRVNGEVLYPTLVRYNEKFSFKDYIIGAGGFTERAARKRSYVVNANGSAKGTKSFFFIKDYPRLSPGAEIYVPLKREREHLRTVEVLTIIVSLVTLAAISYNTFHH